MILIADSGSTKCDWKLLEGRKVVASMSTMGFNPYFHTEEIISQAILNEPLLADCAKNVTSVFIYSAGCSSENLKEIVENGLLSVFSKADIHVDHDVLGAALAACQGKPGIACILGTGSNACFYDGKNISQAVPSLAYILGDEGSGSWYGKQLLRDYLYLEPIPSEIREELEQLGYTKDNILENIYRKPHANVYLASFMKILSGFTETDYVQTMVHNGMKEFLKRHVCPYQNYQEVPVNFVGSIAYYFQDMLKDEAEKLGITIGNIVQKPIDGLVAFHLSSTEGL